MNRSTASSRLSRRHFLQAGASFALATALPRLDLGQTAPSDRKLGWALVGIGTLSRFQLLPALTKTKHAQLSALVSGTPEVAGAMARKYGLDARRIYNYQTFDSIKDDPAIDVVYIVLPNGMHAEYVIRAAKAGKHVFCEKPMANSPADCRAMIDACKEAKKLLGIGYRMQTEPHLLEMRRLIKEGAIGKITRVQSEFGFGIRPGTWRTDKKLGGGGPLMDVGIYCINSTRFALGENPVEVSATIPDAGNDPRFKEVEPAMDFTMTFPEGVVADGRTSYKGFVGNRLRIEGEKGALHMEPAFSYGGLMLGIEIGKAPRKMFTPAPADQFATEIDAFSQSILNNTAPVAPGEEGLEDMKIIEALYRSAGEKKAVKL